jgi:hypothetical protein
MWEEIYDAIVDWTPARLMPLPLHISPAAAGGAPKSHDDHRRQVDVTFTKWISTYPAMVGHTRGDIAGDSSARSWI